MADIDSLKDSVAELVFDVARRRRIEALRKRQEHYLEQARRAIELSKPKQVDRRVVT
jgi:hypothetical protein